MLSDVDEKPWTPIRYAYPRPLHEKATAFPVRIEFVAQSREELMAALKGGAFIVDTLPVSLLTRVH